MQTIEQRAADLCKCNLSYAEALAQAKQEARQTITNPIAQRKYDELVIEHNHGSVVLKDVVIEDGGYVNAYGNMFRVAEGTVVEGSSTNRLFHATSTTYEPVGQRKRFDIYGKTPVMYGGRARVSLVTCGKEQKTWPSSTSAKTPKDRCSTAPRRCPRQSK